MDTAKLEKLFALLASDKDGEVLATVGAIKRVLKAGGMDLHDVGKLMNKPPKVIEIKIPPPAPPAEPKQDMGAIRKMIDELCQTNGFLSEREREFVDSLADHAAYRGWECTTKQASWLYGIHGRWIRSRRSAHTAHEAYE